jgi:hypothetical protein
MERDLIAPLRAENVALLAALGALVHSMRRAYSVCDEYPFH